MNPPGSWAAPQLRGNTSGESQLRGGGVSTNPNQVGTTAPGGFAAPVGIGGLASTMMSWEEGGTTQETGLTREEQRLTPRTWLAGAHLSRPAVGSQGTTI